MPDQDSSATTSNSSNAARGSQEAGIADESAAYENAIEKDAPASFNEGDPKTTNDGNGTSEAD